MIKRYLNLIWFHAASKCCFSFFILTDHEKINKLKSCLPMKCPWRKYPYICKVRKIEFWSRVEMSWTRPELKELMFTSKTGKVIGNITLLCLDIEKIIIWIYFIYPPEIKLYPWQYQIKLIWKWYPTILWFNC